MQLVIYHLLVDGRGRNGYLHYESDIGAFLDENWSRIIPNRKRTSYWINTMAGIMSTSCPAIFKSGTEELHEPGWWTLQVLKPPDPDHGPTRGKAF